MGILCNLLLLRPSSDKTLRFYHNFDIYKNTTYNERKKLSIATCKDLLLKYNQENISFFINHKKKDDLADCFLQSFYFFIHKKIINI